MRHSFYKLLLVISLLYPTCLIIGLVSQAQTQSPRVKYNPNAWEGFSPENGKFTILIPGTPKETSQSIGALTNKIYSLETNFSDFVVSYADLPKVLTSDDDIKRLFDGGINGIIAQKNGRLLSDKAIMLDNYPGREYVVETISAPSTILKVRVYLVSNRLFQIVVVQPKTEGRLQATIDYYNGIANKFLKSFKLLK